VVLLIVENLLTKFEVCSFSRLRDIKGGPKLYSGSPNPGFYCGEDR